MWTQEQRDRYRSDGRRYPSDLTDAEWETVEPLFADYSTLSADLREMVNSCLYLQRTGCPWRYLPTDFGAWETVCTWHDRFRRDGAWAEASRLLARAVRQRRGRAAEPSTGIMDSQSVATGPQKGPRGTDGNKKVRGVKRHVLTCSLGFVLAVAVTAANVHDSQAAPGLLERAAADGVALARVRVDASYWGRPLDEAAARHGTEFQATMRAEGERAFRPLPLRWRIESTFGTLKNRYRRLTRNLEQSPQAAEDAVEVANFNRVLLAYSRADPPEPT